VDVQECRGRHRPCALRYRTTDIAIPSRMSCSLTTNSVIPARAPNSSARTVVTIAPPPITSTRPGCIGP